MDWKDLVSQESIDKAKAAAEKKFGHLSKEDIDYLRWRAKNDLFFLADAVLGYNKITALLHGHICAWLNSTQSDQYRMVLLPRSYFKTTLVTISDSIQIALPSSPGDESEKHSIKSLGTNARIMLGHESHEGASRFLYEITSHFASNVKLMALFPECIPSERVQRMNRSELELPRSQHWSEPTFDTIGVGQRSQGRHYDWIKLDDIYGDKARDSRAERETTIQWFDNIQSFLVSLTESHIDIIGTRYSIDDVYGHAMEAYGKSLVKYIRRIEEYDENTGKLVITFPERFSVESVAVLRKNPKVWVQYSNHPYIGITKFEQGWKRYYEWRGRNAIVVFKGNYSQVLNVRDMDISILMDPARTGSNGLIVSGVDSKGNIYILDAIKDSFRDPDLVNLIFSLVQRWWPRVVAIEDVLFSSLYKPWFESEMKLRNVRFMIQPVKRKRIPGSGVQQSKNDHIAALSQYFSAGLIHFHESQNALIEEYDSFGALDGNLHLLDAMAYGPQIWRPGVSAEQWNTIKKAEESMLNDRDVFTGYSAINYD